jgi:5-methyltetrahydrofolate--homocysteine methyltransferase
MNIKVLTDHSPLLFDGAMGTEIQKSGLQQGESPEIINLRNPEAVKNIHMNYISAGAGVIATNTFGANRLRLEHELKKNVREVNFAAAKIALSAAGNTIFTAGSVGPTGSVLEPFGDLDISEAEDIFSEQITALLDGGIKIILIETMMSLDEALVALKAAKKSGAPVTGVTMTYNITGNDINTSFGESLEYCCKTLIDNGSDFIGSNCGNGFDNMLKIGKKIRDISTVPVLLQPNAGLPVIENNKMIYKGLPEEYATFVKESLNSGIEFFGGCCGTTYSHIKAASEIIKEYIPVNKV